MEDSFTNRSIYQQLTNCFSRLLYNTAQNGSSLSKYVKWRLYSFHIATGIKRERVPIQLKKNITWRNKKVQSYFQVFCVYPPSLLSVSVLRCLSPSLVSSSLSFPSWQLAMLSLCFSLHTDNCCSDLRWTALESGGSCLLLYWGMCLLYCKDEGPWILDILPSSPPPPTISFRHSDCLPRLVSSSFLYFALSDSIWHRHWIKCMCLHRLCIYPVCFSQPQTFHYFLFFMCLDLGGGLHKLHYSTYFFTPQFKIWSF